MDPSNAQPPDFGFVEEASPASRSRHRGAGVLLVIAWLGVAVFAWSRPLPAEGIQPRTLGVQLRINHDPAQRLQALHGIGPALARAIVTHREIHGPFATAAELENVSGIGPLTRHRIAPWVSLD